MAETQIDKTIGERVEELISVLQLNKSRFAASIGMHTSQFSKTLRGDRGFTIEKIWNIASQYNVSLEWLIGGKGEMLLVEGRNHSTGNESSRQERDDQVQLVFKESELKSIAASLATIQKAIAHAPVTQRAIHLDSRQRGAQGKKEQGAKGARQQKGNDQNDRN